jgi:hypothetical protein
MQCFQKITTSSAKRPVGILERGTLFNVFNVAVPGQYVALVLLLVGVPQFSSLGIQRARANQLLV